MADTKSENRPLVDPRELISAPEVARIIGCSLPTAHAYMRCDRVPSVLVCGRLYARLADANAFALKFPPMIPRSTALRMIELKSSESEADV